MQLPDFVALGHATRALRHDPIMHGPCTWTLVTEASSTFGSSKKVNEIRLGLFAHSSHGKYCESTAMHHSIAS